MRPSENIENLVKKNRYKFSSETREKVFENVLEEIEKNKEQPVGIHSPALWRIIMKNSMIKLAAAAIIVIAVLIGLNPFGCNMTFAQVIDPILNAKTMILDLIMGNDESGPVMHEIIAGSRIRRTMSNIPNMTMVIDLEIGNMLVLDSDAKTASYVDIQGELKDRTQSYVNFLRNIITRIKENPDIENLGEKTIDGHKVIGFTGKGPNDEVTIWADIKTALPIRVYLRIGQMFSIMKNFQLDTSVDESLLSMDVPKGYTKKDTQVDLGNATEKDFIESLRIWASILNDGIFPDSIGTENAMKEIPELGQKINALNLPEEQATQLGMVFGKGMLFHQIIDSRGDQWKYIGAGVKYGDKSKVIFWYQPKVSTNYRVIYGDLHVEDVSPDSLPK